MLPLCPFSLHHHWKHSACSSSQWQGRQIGTQLQITSVLHQLSARTTAIAIDIASWSFNVLVQFFPTFVQQLGCLHKHFIRIWSRKWTLKVITYRGSDELELRRARWRLSQTCPNTRGCHISASPTSHLRRRSWSKPVSAQCESYSILKPSWYMVRF